MNRYNIGDRVIFRALSPNRTLKEHRGTISRTLPHDIFAVLFDGNSIGATQNILGSRLYPEKK